jgi:hypothetical protein
MKDKFYLFLMISSFILLFIILIIKWIITWIYYKRFKNKFQGYPNFLSWYGHLFSLTDFGKGLDIFAESFIMTFYLPVKRPDVVKSKDFNRNRTLQFLLLFIALLLFCNFLVSFFYYLLNNWPTWKVIK